MLKHNLKSLRYFITLAFLFISLGFTHSISAMNSDKIKVYFLAQNYAAAIKEGEGLVVRDEITLELYYYLGLSYLKIGNYQRASDCFRSVINNQSDNKLKEAAMLGLADSYFLNGDYVNAEGVYNDLLKNPKTKLKEQVLQRLNDMPTKSGDSLQPNLADLNYSVQVGSFSSMNNALNLTNKLKNRGYSAYIVISQKLSGKAYQVRVGKLRLRSQAEELSKKLSRDGYPVKVCP
jgi:tetratricopeptide (TPR) repeat protein